MSLSAGRVGVNPSEVDPVTGKLITGGSISVVDNLNSDSSTDALSAKQGKVLKQTVDNKEDASKIGGFEFRDHEGQAQYRTSASGEWVNFSSGVVFPDINETDSNYSLLLLFTDKTTPLGTINAKLYNNYSQATGLTDLIGECDMLNISGNMYACILNLKSSSSARTCYLNICDDDTNIQLSTYTRSGNGSVELGNIATNVNISSNETGVEFTGIY